MKLPPPRGEPIHQDPSRTCCTHLELILSHSLHDIRRRLLSDALFGFFITSLVMRHSPGRGLTPLSFSKSTPPWKGHTSPWDSLPPRDPSPPPFFFWEELFFLHGGLGFLLLLCVHNSPLTPSTVPSINYKSYLLHNSFEHSPLLPPFLMLSLPHSFSR